MGRRGARPFMSYGMRPVGFFERGSGMPDPYAPREWRSEPVGARHASPATDAHAAREDVGATHAPPAKTHASPAINRNN